MAGTTLILQDGAAISLSVKEDRFCRSVALNGNQTAAWRDNFADNSTNRDYDRQKAYALIAKNEKIQLAIEHYKLQFSKGLQLSENRFLSEIAAIAFADPGDMYDEDGMLMPLSKMPERVRRAIKKVKVRRVSSKKIGKGEKAKIEYEDEIEIELGDKLRALERVGQIKGYLEKEKDKASNVRVIMSADGVSVDVSG